MAGMLYPVLMVGAGFALIMFLVWLMTRSLKKAAEREHQVTILNKYKEGEERAHEVESRPLALNPGELARRLRALRDRLNSK